MKCPNDYTRFDALKEDCIDCFKNPQCQEGKVKFQSKEVIRHISHTVSTQYGEWFESFVREIITLRLFYLEKETEMRMMYYHELGKYIIKELLDNKEKAKYGEKILHECAKLTGIAESNLHASVKFYRMYPKLEDCPAVNWSKAKKLIANDGDTKVLSECLHKHTEMRKFCIDCHRQVK